MAHAAIDLLPMLPDHVADIEEFVTFFIAIGFTLMGIVRASGVKL